VPDYIFNTTALSNFAAVNRLDLLANRYRGRAFTTVEVGDELRRGLNAGYIYLEAAWQQLETINPAGWLRLSNPESAEEHRWRAEFGELLDPGEASCLALAISRQLTFVTGDLAARRLAQSHQMPLTGTVGILIALVRQASLPLDEANAILSIMIERRYRAPIDRLDDLI
jgi:predicted nucleic acid-binding protein